MKCAVCKYGETKRGTATVTLTRDTTTVVVKGVPADLCDNCGEEYVDETTTARLLSTVEDAAREGVEVEVREYIAA